MNKRPLGKTGLDVSEIGFGAWQLCNSDSWGGMNEQTAHRLVHEAVERGINLFDTAPNDAHTKSEVLEILFNVFHQDVRRSFATVREHGAGTIAKVPLDSGWLTGQFDRCSRFDGIRSRWTGGEIAQRAELVSRIGWLSADGSELAHKAIGFLLSYDEVSCVIPGTRTLDQLKSNVAATGQRLSPDERSKLEEFWDEVTEGGSKLLPW